MTAAVESLSTTEAARRLGVSTPTVQRWVDAGLLRAWKTPGGHRRIEAASVQALQAAPRTDVTRLDVVIVDDNPVDRELMEAAVHEALPAAQVGVFDDGVPALLAIGRHAPSVVITDIVLPHMDGLEVVRRLAALPQARPALLIVVSATVPQAQARAGGLPADAVFLRKPLDARALVELLRRRAA